VCLRLCLCVSVSVSVSVCVCVCVCVCVREHYTWTHTYCTPYAHHTHTNSTPKVPNAEVLTKSVPTSWAEGVEFSKAASVSPGDLVVVDGPSGLFFATIEKKTGLPWQQTYSVVVQVTKP